MTTSTNKQLLQRVFAELSEGRSGPFIDSLGPDVRWTIVGTTPWSGTYAGKEAVQRDLLAPLFSQFGDRYTSHPRRFVAEGDTVVVETQGRVTTKSGQRYDNTYCFLFRLAGGQVTEITEYCDTQLVATVLAPPARAPQPAS